jgi:hypothetical protein
MAVGERLVTRTVGWLDGPNEKDGTLLGLGVGPGDSVGRRVGVFVGLIDTDG